MRPKFLEHVTVSRAQKARLTPFLQNWLVAAPFVRTASLDDLERLLVLEIDGARRTGMIDRLHGRLAMQRRQSERAQILFL